jgi:hypothetical protein
MKTTHILILASLIAFVGCGEKVSELDQKKASLKTLKEQLGEIKTQILTLEKEIALADTLVKDGIASVNWSGKALYFSMYLKLMF